MKIKLSMKSFENGICLEEFNYWESFSTDIKEGVQVKYFFNDVEVAEGCRAYNFVRHRPYDASRVDSLDGQLKTLLKHLTEDEYRKLKTDINRVDDLRLLLVDFNKNDSSNKFADLFNRTLTLLNRTPEVLAEKFSVDPEEVISWQTGETPKDPHSAITVLKYEVEKTLAHLLE